MGGSQLIGKRPESHEESHTASFHIHNHNCVGPCHAQKGWGKVQKT